MFIYIVPRVAENPHWFPVLDVIAGTLERAGNRHAVDPACLSALRNSKWIADKTDPSHVRQTTIQFASQIAKSATRSLPSDAVVLLVDDTANEPGEININDRSIKCSPYDALFLILYPFSLIVENDVSDGAFLLWMARALGQDQFNAAYKTGRLTFRSAGGKGEIAKSAQALSLGVWPQPGRYIAPMVLRCAAVLDNDSRYPGEGRNEHIREATATHVSFVHILKSRTIENYLTPGLIRRRMEPHGLGRLADAFGRLTELQRSHFPMKDGFRRHDDGGKIFQQAEFLADLTRPDAERELFGDVPEPDWVDLAQGFGKRLASVFQEPNFRPNPNDISQIPRELVDEMRMLISTVIRYL